MNKAVGAERRGLHLILKFSVFYTSFQSGLGSGRAARKIESDYLAPLLMFNGKILDIGCGPARFLNDHPSLDASRYVGLEPNSDYVRAAQKRYPHARFHHGTAESHPEGLGQNFSLVLLSGVLHHMDDDTAISTLEYAKRHLSPGGALFTVDPVFTNPQNRVAQFLARNDRGRFVRSVEAYNLLLRAGLAKASSLSEVRDDLLRIPYSHYISLTHL